jgi:FkbM family methyltransferase
MEALDLLAPFGFLAKGIIHVGANTGIEFASYRASEADTVIYVEPTPDAFWVLTETVSGTPGHHPVKAVCSARPNEIVTFNVSSNKAESSSLFELGNHGVLYPDIVYTERLELTTTTVDEIVATQFPGKTLNLLVIDVQGAELLVLKGATQTMDKLEAIYCEVSDIRLYEGSCTWQEINAFLEPHGFRMKHMVLNIHHWGNALFVKEAVFAAKLQTKDVARPGVNIALNGVATQSSISPYSRTDDAQGAVNGIITGVFGFHTAKENHPWWQVDLLVSTPLKEVIVFNRIDRCAARAYAFVLKLGDENGVFTQVYAQNGRTFGGKDGTPARIELEGATARYVRIELTTDDYLHLDQVEVYAAP